MSEKDLVALLNATSAKVFGEVDSYKIFNYPNDIVVAISRKENEIVVGAKQNGKQIYGQGWYFEPVE